MSKSSRRLFLVIGLVGLAFGGWRIASYVINQPPDPDTAPMNELLAFMTSEGFGELSPEKRQAYVERAYSKPQELDEAQGKQLAEVWTRRLKDDREGAVKGMVTMAMSMIMNEVDKYSELSPKERKAYWNRKLIEKLKFEEENPNAKDAMARQIAAAMAKRGNTGSEQPPEKDGEESTAKEPKDGQIVEHVEASGTDGLKLLLDAVSAEQRAKMINMMQDGRAALGDSFDGSMFMSPGGGQGQTGTGIRIQIGSPPKGNE